MVTADPLFIFLVTVAVVILCWSDRPRRHCRSAIASAACSSTDSQPIRALLVLRP
jgi:hypothetical protein